MALKIYGPRPKCRLDICRQISASIGLCQYHYTRHRSGKPLDVLPRDTSTSDVIDGRKKCSKCLNTKSVESFRTSDRNNSGLVSWCKTCHDAKNKQCRDARLASGIVPSETKSYRRMRLRVLSHYSGGTPSCNCCDITDIEFLSIDHVDGNGSEHRRQLKAKSRSVYRDIILSGMPFGYRVLCHNCNQSYGLYGYCPHTDNDSSTSKWMNRKSAGLSAQAKIKKNKGQDVN